MNISEVARKVETFFRGLVASVEPAMQADWTAVSAALNPVAQHLAQQAQADGMAILAEVAPMVQTQGLEEAILEAGRRLAAQGKVVGTEAIAAALAALSHAAKQPASPPEPVVAAAPAAAVPATEAGTSP